MPITCPKCAHVRSDHAECPAWQCPQCGIAYAKFRPAIAVEDTGAVVLPPAHASRGWDVSDAIQLSAGLCAAMLLGKVWFGAQASVVNALLLVPFFFTLVPVLSFGLCGELWQWDRYRFRFEIYDFDVHPIIGRCLVVFYFAATIIFAVFFFMLNIGPGGLG